jgi:uncharacterized protein YqeY
MNNEPVAWMARNELLFSVVKDEIHYIPLYTHPPKELTDDEIADLIKATNDETGFGHIRIFDFVKAFLKVLRKAQEK